MKVFLAGVTGLCGVLQLHTVREAPITFNVLIKRCVPNEFWRSLCFAYSYHILCTKCITENEATINYLVLYSLV